MAKGVYVKDQGVVEFPDETDEQTMLRSLRRKFSNIGKSAIGAGEAAISIGSAALAEPVSGLTGLIGTALPGDEGQGAKFVQSVGDAMTYEPTTEKGIEYMQKVAEILQPLGDVIQGASQNLGDKAYSATGSALAGAIGYSLPTAMLDGLGLKGLNIARRPVSGADLYSARMGGGPVDKLSTFYHTSPEEIEKISKYGRFGSNLFFSREPYLMTEANSPTTYKMAVDESKLINAPSIPYMDMTDSQRAIYNNKISAVADRLGIDDLDLAEDLLTEKKSIFDTYEDLNIDPGDAGEISWDLQKMLGDLGDELGFDGVLATDEQGQVLISNMFGKESKLVKDK